VDIKLEEGGY